ncbi:hypothetical protein F3H65_11630 [Klebsiella quasipneumoniae]|nr:hypothetical protein [Klebsiella quasipneumoniae]MBK2472295.1 hypothetical protein [Klebsiella quasipneumoniae]MBZ7537206.1 hypothetical protein [Klebsiella quasipneumoniae]TNJ92870.1 hypothetical protein CI663_012510 [Klebsiella quasipneumoniae subsp. similipneumoniae]
MPLHTIPRPINIDAKRANRVVEIKMLVIMMPLKVRMQIIRHGGTRKVPYLADYLFTSVFPSGASEADVISRHRS